MGGLSNICKMYGGMKVTQNGKTVTYIWDHINDEPRLEGSFSAEEWDENERAKWGKLKRRVKPKAKPDAENRKMF